MQAFLSLIRWNKPIGSLLLLWPTYWGLWLAAGGFPGWRWFLLFTLGVFIMRSAGCIINDLTDVSWDAKVERTQKRPLVLNQISRKKAWSGFWLLLFAALCLVSQMNHLTQLLAVIAASLTMLYPFMKRYTYYPQVILGAAWSFGPLMAFSALQNHLSINAFLVYAAVVFWAIAFDTYYALTDLEDDRKIGVKSPAVHLEKWTPLFALFCHLVAFALLLVIGHRLKLGSLYTVSWYVGLILVLLQYYQVNQALKYAPPKEAATKAFAAFYQNHWIELIVFLGIVGSL